MSDIPTIALESVGVCLARLWRGRKLERFGGVILDRPAPPAVNLACSNDVDWKLAAARIDADGRVVAGATPSGRWQAHYGNMIFNLSRDSLRSRRTVS